jgi:hypothetical protein
MAQASLPDLHWHVQSIHGGCIAVAESVHPAAFDSQFREYWLQVTFHQVVRIEHPAVAVGEQQVGRFGLDGFKELSEVLRKLGRKNKHPRALRFGSADNAVPDFPLDRYNSVFKCGAVVSQDEI